MENISVKLEHDQEKQATDEKIKALEGQENQLLQTMQVTRKRKVDAIERLKGKSPALKNGIEPRGAYLSLSPSIERF